jgi:HEAT repeat protein
MTTTARSSAAALLIGFALTGCAKNSGEVWSSKSESLYSRPNRASVSADDQPITGTRMRPAAANPESEHIEVTKAPPPKFEPADVQPADTSSPPVHAAAPEQSAPAPGIGPAPDPAAPNRIDTRLAREPVMPTGELRQQAIEILLKAADARNPLLRAYAIEALQPAADYIQVVVRHGLGDENRGVRFVAAMVVGRLKLEDLAPLLEPMLHDESQSVQAAAIYGLMRCGRTVNPTPLATMLMSNDPEVKGNAAYILGEMGDRSAIQLLEHAIGRGLERVAPARVKIVELQLAEAMVKLGAESQVVPIRAALFAAPEEAELVALSCQMCGRMHDGKATADLNNLLVPKGDQLRPPEIRMAAAAALAQIDPRNAHPNIPLEYINNADAQIRAQAATTLGIIGDRRTLPQLAQLMDDPNPLVQVAASGAVLTIDKRG